MLHISSDAKRAGRRILSFVLAFVITVSAVLFCGSSNVSAAPSELTDATVKAFEEQIAALEAKQKEIMNQLTKLRNQQASWNEQKAQIDSYLNTVERKMAAADILISELENQIAHTMQEIDATKGEYERIYDQFLTQIVVTYEEGEASYLGLILGSDSLGDFLSRMEQVSSMLEYKKNIMNDLQAKRMDLEAREADLSAKLAIQQDTLKQLEADKAVYQAEADAAIAEIAKLEKNESAALKSYYAYKAEEDKLDKELEEYLLELQRKNAAKMEAGEWLWPIPLSAEQYCSSPFGWRKLYGVWDYHRGWDIACWLGTDIMASKGGTVVIATFHNSYGNYVVIDHGDGVSTVYAHASKLLVSKGDTVKKGDVIAKVGTTGNSTGYHLHFEFRLNGKYTDPFGYIKNPPIKVGASRYEKW